MTRRTISRPLTGLLLAGLMLSVAACRLVRTTVDAPVKAVGAITPGKKQKPATDVVELQQNLLRFADAYSARMLLGVERLRRGTNGIDSAEALRWKLAFGTHISSIASGPNAFANLLDMSVFVTVTRMSLEQYWQPKVFGEAVQPLLEAAQASEAEIWQLASGALDPAQQKELRAAAEAWYRQNPLPESVLAARAVGFAAQLQSELKGETAKEGSVFDLLKLDPLSGLDPATREIAETRLFAERALYVAHRTPMLLRLQAELTALEATSIPAVQQVLTNSSQIADALERFAGVAERLPGQLSTEREEILKALESQEKSLQPLLAETRQTLLAGSQMSTSLDTTLRSFDTVMQRFGVGQTNSAGPPATNAEPFRIQDYQQTAAQLEATAKQLTTLLLTLDQTVGSTNLERLSTRAASAVSHTQASAKDLVNYIFWRAVLFVAIALVLLLVYRRLAALSSRLPPGRS